MIKSDYLINEETIALLPAKQIDYDTISLELRIEVLIKQPSLQLIKKACFKHASSYDGRRDAVIYHTNFIQKTPIPINPDPLPKQHT